MQLGSSSGSSGTDSDDDDNLPFPEPLPRADFLRPDFSASAYLGSLRNRHQTLEDLRAELRSRSQLLNRELVDLVNSNYQDFLGLGGSLRGGDEKVEEVKLGLLGFKKDVADVREKVAMRVVEVGALLEERKETRRKIMLGRKMLEYDQLLEELEERLAIESSRQREEDSDESDLDESSDDDEGEDTLVPLSKLRRHVQRYLIVKKMEAIIGKHHPFVVAQGARMMQVRNTLMLDLSSALKQAKEAKQSASKRTIGILSMYRDMDESSEAVKVLKGTS